MTREDFRRYEARVHRERLVVRVDENLRIYVPPPPSSGILVPTVIRIMKSKYYKIHYSETSFFF